MKIIFSFGLLLLLFTGCTNTTTSTSLNSYYTTDITPVKAAMNLAATKIYVNDGRVNEKVNGFTALVYAVGNDEHLSITKYLVNNGAKLTSQNKAYAPMWHAVSGGNIETIKFLQSKGLKIREELPNGINPIENLKNRIKIYSDQKKQYSSNQMMIDIVDKEIIKSKKAILYLQPFFSKGYKEYKLTQKINTLDAYKKFLEENPKSDFIKQVKEKIAFIEYTSLKNPTHKIYMNFMKKYPLFSKNIEIMEIIKKQTNNKAKLAFVKIQKSKNIQRYEAFIVQYPFATEVEEAKKFILIDKSKKILTKIKQYLKSKDIGKLESYINGDISIKNIATRLPLVSLLYSGPKELNVITLLKYKNQGIGDLILSSKVKSIKQPYKDFSLDEISTLSSFGLNDIVIAAMLDSTSSYNDKVQRQKEQQRLLHKQQELAHDIKASQKENLDKIKRENAQNRKTLNENKESNPLLDKATDKLLEVGAKKLLESLF